MLHRPEQYRIELYRIELYRTESNCIVWYMYRTVELPSRCLSGGGFGSGIPAGRVDKQGLTKIHPLKHRPRGERDMS